MGRSIQSILQSLASNPALKHTVRTTAAGMASALVARLFGLPEIWWAVVSTLVVMQSSLDTSLPIASRRLIGTALGAAIAALLSLCFRSGVWMLGVGLFLLGLLCAMLRRSSINLQEKLDRTAYRYGGITLAITVLISRSDPIWLVAIHRSFEVSIGIAVALMLAVVWPERAAR